MNGQRDWYKSTLDEALALLRQHSKTWDNVAYEDGDAERDMENTRAFLARYDGARDGGSTPDKLRASIKRVAEQFNAPRDGKVGA